MKRQTNNNERLLPTAHLWDTKRTIINQKSIIVSKWNQNSKIEITQASRQQTWSDHIHMAWFAHKENNYGTNVSVAFDWIYGTTQLSQKKLEQDKSIKLNYTFDMISVVVWKMKRREKGRENKPIQEINKKQQANKPFHSSSSRIHRCFMTSHICIALLIVHICFTLIVGHR